MINKTVLRMISRFRDLLELAKTEFVCDEEFDKEMFCDLIKNCYEYFLKERDADKAFDTDEIELYSQLYAYSQIPCIIEGANSAIFEVSTVIAYRLSEAILKQNYSNPKNYLYIDDDTMILRCVVDDEDVRYRYNFNDRDFSEYKQMIDDDYLI